MEITFIILFLSVFVIYSIAEESWKRFDGVKQPTFAYRLKANLKANWKWWLCFSLCSYGINHYKGDYKNGLVQLATASVVFLLIVLIGAVQNREDKKPEHQPESYFRKSNTTS